MSVRLVKCIALLAAVVGSWLTINASAQGPGFPLPLEPIGNSNEAVFPAYEGWGESQDGSGYLIVLGYKNRNRTETVEIPIGPNIRIEPGGPDYGSQRCSSPVVS